MLPDELIHLINSYEDNLQDCPWRRNWQTDQRYRECISVEDRARIGGQMENVLRHSPTSVSTEALERLVALRDAVVEDRIVEVRNIHDDYEEHHEPGGFYSAQQIRGLADSELKRRGLVLNEGKAWDPEELLQHRARQQESAEIEQANRLQAEKSARAFEIWTFVGLAALFVVFALIILNA